MEVPTNISKCFDLKCNECTYFKESYLSPNGFFECPEYQRFTDEMLKELGLKKQNTP